MGSSYTFYNVQVHQMVSFLLQLRHAHLHIREHVYNCTCSYNDIQMFIRLEWFLNQRFKQAEMVSLKIKHFKEFLSIVNFAMSWWVGNFLKFVWEHELYILTRHLNPSLHSWTILHSVKIIIQNDVSVRITVRMKLNNRNFNI